MDPTYPLVPMVNAIACVLVLVSLSKSMFQSWNVGVCSLAIWVVVMSFSISVNSIIWAGNVENVAPVWCDITTRLGLASGSAIPASFFVIIRRLSVMMRQRDPSASKRQKMNLLVDLFICVGTPVIQLSLYYIVQNARFMILEELGCVANDSVAGLTILLVGSVPIVFSVLSLTLYTPRIIWVYYKHKELDDFFASNTPLDRRGFSKILTLGLFDILITFPIALFDLIMNLIQFGGRPVFWPGWRAAHLDISSIQTVTADEWKSAGLGTTVGIRFSEWSNPVFAIVFFSLFGLTEKNRMWYRSVFWKILRPFGFKPRPDPVASSIAFGSGSVPTLGESRMHNVNGNDSMNTDSEGQSFVNAADIEARQHYSASHFEVDLPPLPDDTVKSPL